LLQTKEMHVNIYPFSIEVRKNGYWLCRKLGFSIRGQTEQPMDRTTEHFYF